MKKFVFTLLLVFVCHLGYAQSINGLFNEFGSEKNADCVKVSSFMMSLGKMFAGHDEGEKVRVLMKAKKETIRELLFVCTGKEDCTLVQINGKFTKEDIDKLVNQETKKKHGRR